MCIRDRDITPENSAIIAHIFEVAARLAGEFQLENGFRIVTNCGEDGGQTVPHLHFHLLGGRSMKWPPDVYKRQALRWTSR